MSYIADAGQVLLSMLRRKFKPTAEQLHWYYMGRASVGLDLVTQVKNLESLPVVSELGRQEAISAIHTVLMASGLEAAYELYDELAEWRKPTFVAQRSGPVRGGNASSDDADAPRLPSSPSEPA